MKKKKKKKHLIGGILASFDWAMFVSWYSWIYVFYFQIFPQVAVIKEYSAKCGNSNNTFLKQIWSLE